MRDIPAALPQPAVVTAKFATSSLMKASVPCRRAAFAIAGVLSFFSGSLVAADGDEIVAVYSAISPDYHRTKLSNGAFKTETYAFGEGGAAGGGIKDQSFDKLHFLDIAHAIAPSLSAQSYIPCDTTNPNATDLLIMVYWGTTIGTDRTSTGSEYQIAQSFVPPPRADMSPPPTGGSAAMVSDPSTSGRGSEGAILAAQRIADDSARDQAASLTKMANRQRDRQNAENAMILGYLTELKRVDSYQMTPLAQRRLDVLSEVEESRYYVVLMAYDFQTILKHKERKLLWETRFSIRERHNDFEKQLAAMAQSAAHFFGQDSGGLLRKPMPAVQVEMGELKSLGPEH